MPRVKVNMKWRGNKFRAFLDDVGRGRKSGYSWCCVIWFFIRNDILRVHLGKTKFAKWWDKKENIVRARNSQHICCPYHIFVDKSVLMYYTCPECKWRQLGKGKCNLCGKPTKYSKRNRIK